MSRIKSTKVLWLLLGVLAMEISGLEAENPGERDWSNRCQPRHIHIASGSSPGTSMTISFATPFKCGRPFEVLVLYDKKMAGNGTQVNTTLLYGSSIVETRQYNVTQPNAHDYISAYFHHVTLSGLNPSTAYSYQCAVIVSSPLEYSTAHSIPEPSLLTTFQSSAERLRHRNLYRKKQYVSSKIYQFSTPPLPSVKDSYPPVKFALVGDLGQTSDSAGTVYHMRREIPSLTAILHAGDLSYADCEHIRWDTWFDLIEPLSTVVPWHVCPGNHELELECNTGRVYTSYRSRFKMPSVTNHSEIIKPVDIRHRGNKFVDKCTPSVFMTEYDYGNSFHSVTFGQVHVIFLNSYTSSKPASRQYRWVESELHSLDRIKVPWIIIVMHCPFYNTFASHQHEKQEEQMKQHLEPLFFRYQVNIVVAGHTHAYSRSKPVAYNSVPFNGKAPTYIVVGDGGNREGHDKFKSQDAEEWVHVRDATTYGFGLLNVLNVTHAKWQWIKNINEEEVGVHDEGYIWNQYFL